MEQDESIGEISTTFLGPSPTDYLTNAALVILNNYLTHSATAPLQKEFIEIPKPYCTGIGFYSEDRVNKNELTCSVQDIPVKYLDSLMGMIKDKLRKIVESEGIDMDRMGLVLRRDKRKLLNYMETGVSSVLADAVIGGMSFWITLNELI
jgi:Zn-dependent M16 (insulinase) family peptidase